MELIKGFEYEYILTVAVPQIKTYYKRVNHSTTDNMLAVPVSFHDYALKCRPSLHQKLGY